MFIQHVHAPRTPPPNPCMLLVAGPLHLSYRTDMGGVSSQGLLSPNSSSAQTSLSIFVSLWGLPFALSLPVLLCSDKHGGYPNEVPAWLDWVALLFPLGSEELSAWKHFRSETGLSLQSCQTAGHVLLLSLLVGPCEEINTNSLSQSGQSPPGYCGRNRKHSGSRQLSLDWSNAFWENRKLKYTCVVSLSTVDRVCLSD